ncbi:hypothetical protein [Asticcacaulis taihuensis]|uniref:Uncharacterized protein n=1 Tax=Asticcacaulis taihuensis TaxID=260084 RepID=A0A1G4QDC7_9CAUL|nr:hypothetical protein [Asticcacaulis taihuensis]SCW42451.1 hypothetical protein SAMN02927928_1128 [Asticcacaulis taihuensis]
MTIRRFILWLGERLIEWQLAIALLLAVKFLLPVSSESYADFPAFAVGMRETLGNSLADAAFMTQNFMNGDWGLYWANAWRAAGWIIGLHIYLQGIYLFTSLLARRVAPDYPVRGSLIAWVVSFAVLCGLYYHYRDPGSLRLALCLLVGGGLVVASSAAFGLLFTTPVRSVPSRSYSPLPRGPILDEAPPDLPGKLQADLPAVAAPQPSVFRRERLYFSD